MRIYFVNTARRGDMVKMFETPGIQMTWWTSGGNLSLVVFNFVLQIGWGDTLEQMIMKNEKETKES